MSRLAVWLSACCALMSGCASPLAEVGREPQLSPVGSGVVGAQTAILEFPAPTVSRASANSTWRDTGADLFRDGRALRVGDVVTVKIQIKDRASFDNTSNRSRDSKTDLNASLDYDIGIGGATAAGAGTVEGGIGRKTSTDSKGGIARSESIDLLIAAVITDVLPNGNLILNGSQEVRVNYEVRILNVGGVVRPRDISQDNTIAYDKLAEARISYGGRGRVMEVQQPGWGQQLLDLALPF